MLCRGTAWGQVKNLKSGELTDPDNGVKSLLAALSSWEESTEMRTYEQFEKAIYKTVQKSDESSMSYVNRLQVAMDELGVKSIQEFHAFLLLRQSAVTPEDKKRVLTMTNGEMSTKRIEQAMRTLATSILNSGEVRKKVYPTNYVEPETSFVVNDAEGMQGGGNPGHTYDDHELDQEYVDHLATQGDADALNVLSFEKDLEDMFQEVPDLHSALVSYQEARSKILERKKFRGFWPAAGKSKGKSGGKFQQYRKGGGKGNLLQRISRTFCKACGEKGHWKAECPNKTMASASTDTANFVTHQEIHVVNEADSAAQIIFENDPEAGNRSDDPKLRSLGNRMPKPSNTFDCYHSRPNLGSIAEEGLAILDTGASRSVLGADLWPGVWKNLPAEVQAQVKEAVMESLRMLLIILMNQIEVKAPDQEISANHANSLQSLLEHVNTQKQRIEELSQIIKENRSPKKTRGPAGPMQSENGDLSDHSWELEEEEELIAAAAAPKSPPKRSQPRSSAAPATYPNNASRPTTESVSGTQLALTAQALESWGNKRVSWGRTHNGKRYTEVYEEHGSYVDWIKARAKNATPAMQDFITYAQAREDMEHQAVRGRP
eukprot:s424_g6.t1